MSTQTKITGAEVSDDDVEGVVETRWSVEIAEDGSVRIVGSVPRFTILQTDRLDIDKPTWSLVDNSIFSDTIHDFETVEEAVAAARFIRTR